MADYLVVSDFSGIVGGGVRSLPAGTTISDTQFSIAALQAAGCPLLAKVAGMDALVTTSRGLRANMGSAADYVLLSLLAAGGFINSTASDLLLAKSGGTMTGALRQTPAQIVFAAAMVADVSLNNQFQVTGIITTDFALTLLNGQDGDRGTIAFKQAAAGGKKLTGITVAGRTVTMDAALATLNTAEMLVANTHVVLGYHYVTDGGNATVRMNVVAAVAAAYA